MSGKTYEDASAETYQWLDDLIQRNHPELFVNEIKCSITVVSKLGSEDELIPCLKLHGAYAFATVRLVRAQQRLHLPFDAEITIDAFHWDSASTATKIAVLDHELEHIEICKDRRGVVKTTDLGRVKLRLKPDDYSLTGFYVNVARHGLNAPEYGSLDRTMARAEEALQQHQETAQRPTAPQPNDPTIPVAVAA